MPQIDLIIEDLFSAILSTNEIKDASFPFQQSFFKSSLRYKDIIVAASDEFQ